MRAAVVTLAIMFTAPVVAHAQAISWVVPKAAAACDEAAKVTKIVNREKDLKGPFLILWRDDVRMPWSLGRVSPDYIRRLEYEKKKNAKDFNPMNAREVQMVACGSRGARVKVGEYIITGKSERQPAFGYEFDVRVIEWPGGTPVAQWTDRVEPLSYKKEGDSNVAEPDATNVAITISARLR
jgi:hypothetical protein